GRPSCTSRSSLLTCSISARMRNGGNRCYRGLKRNARATAGCDETMPAQFWLTQFHLVSCPMHAPSVHSRPGLRLHRRRERFLLSENAGMANLLRTADELPTGRVRRTGEVFSLQGGGREQHRTAEVPRHAGDQRIHPAHEGGEEDSLA